MTVPRFGIVLLAAIVPAACASGLKPEVLQAWIGRPAAQLEQDWGPATREVHDGDMRILIYEEVARYSAPDLQDAPQAPRSVYAQARREAEEAYRPPSVHVRSYLFWVDPTGTIVRSELRQP